jgi:hypothetical protein
MFDDLDGVMGALGKKKTQWKEDMFFAEKLARQKLTKHYTEVTPTMGMLPISAHILHPLQHLRFFRQWDKGMKFNLKDETSHTTRCHEAFLKCVENV